MKIIILLLSIPVICFATTISINTDIPNSSGNFTLKDTVLFSNGITLKIKMNYYTATGPSGWNVQGIVFDSSSDLIKVGLCYAETLISQQGGVLIVGNSSDTIWSQANVVPDTLEPLTMGAKWYYCNYGYSTGPSGGFAMQNYNTIIYAQTKENNFKLQIKNIYTTNFHIDSINIFWMVDSLGNGLFPTSAGIRNSLSKNSNKSSSGGTAYKTHLIGFGNSNRNKYADKQKMYSFDGRVMKSQVKKIPEQLFISK